MPSLRLSPMNVATKLFIIVPDRDAKASQICMEALLTIVANGYSLPIDSDNGGFNGPKLRKFALRSLVLGENFYSQPQDSGGLSSNENGGAISLAGYGKRLAAGADFADSENLPLLKEAFKSLIDPQTVGGQLGERLLYPFHESFLWYDSRRASNQWTVRKVRMRGQGISIARIILDPPAQALTGTDRVAVTYFKEALQQHSRLAELAKRIEACVPPQSNPSVPEEDEKASWMNGSNSELGEFASALYTHTLNIMTQTRRDPSSRLWSVRNLFALDFAKHILDKSWEYTETLNSHRHLLLVFGGGPRATNALRPRSEHSYHIARMHIREAIIKTMAEIMETLNSNGETDWKSEFEPRSPINVDDVSERLLKAVNFDDYEALARNCFAKAAYGRPGDGFRVLLESIGMLYGTGQYRYLSASTDLLATMVGALSSEMPMSSRDFFERVFDEWGIVISPESAKSTTLGNEIDGAELARNARRAEQLMIKAGLGVSLSDSTTEIGG